MKKLVILEYPAEGKSADQREYQGKFLQLRLRGGEYLLFARSGTHRFHNRILGQFLEERRIPHRWTTDERLELNFPDLAVIGGGRFKVDTSEKTLSLWDNSQAYGRFDPAGLAEKIAGAEHPWSAFSIRIK